MITLENWATKAVEKLQSQKASVSGQKEKAMADASVSVSTRVTSWTVIFTQSTVSAAT